MNLLAVLLLLGADICVAAESVAVADQGGLAALFQSWPEFGKLMAFVLGLQIILRGLAEGLTRFSDYTDTTWDNKAAAVLSEIVWFLGAVLGKVGYGTPKLVLEESEKHSPEKTVAVNEAPKA